MSRDELVNYISKYAETIELKVLLSTFDEIRKGCVLHDEMNEVLCEVENHLEKTKRTDPDSITIGEAYLKILEGRIMLLLLQQSIAKDLNDRKQAFSISQQITELFTVYVLEGGKRSFRSPEYFNRNKNDHMKIERGIVTEDNLSETMIQTPGHLYSINNGSFYKRKLSHGKKVLGLIKENKFNICREFISNTGYFVFGFITNKNSSPSTLSIQTISDFEQENFDPYFSDYEFGPVVLANVS